MKRLAAACAVSAICSVAFAGDTPSLLSFSLGRECANSRQFEAYGFGSINDKLLLYIGCDYEVLNVSSHIAIPLIYTSIVLCVAAVFFFFARRFVRNRSLMEH
jgi:hypothetical protein